jgi:hypothetical protein
MYERALQGYEKALGHKRFDNYIPALNAIQDLTVLYSQLESGNQRKLMYSSKATVTIRVNPLRV